MRVGRIICLYFITVFVTAALIAPWVYLGIQYAGRNFSWAAGIGHGPFYRYLSRCLRIVALLGLWPLLRAVGLCSFRDLGFRFDRHSFHQWCTGIGWGAASLIIMVALSVTLKERALDSSYSLHEYSRHFQRIGLSALAVSLFEEFIFRGCLFGILRKGFSFPIAALVSGVTFSMLHFLKIPFNFEIIDWSSGFFVLGKIFLAFLDPQNLLVMFNLTLLGIILAWAYEKTGALFLPMGIHAGVIVCEKSFRFLTHALPGNHDQLWGNDKLVEGWVAPVVLLIAFIGLRQQFAARPKPAIQAEVKQ